MSQVREDAQVKADRLGQALVKPKPNELFIDLDSRDALGNFVDRMDVARKFWPTIRLVSLTPSKTKDHYHAIVAVDELDPLGSHERIALQAALGSDPMREMLAIHHGRHGYEHTSVFFESKEDAA